MLKKISKQLFSRFIPKNVYAKHLDYLVSLLLEGRTFHLLDLGAQGGLQPRWSALARYLDVSAVDPNGLSNNITYCDESVGTLYSDKHFEFDNCKSFHPITDILGETEKQVNFFSTADTRLSSLFLPNRKFLSLFPATDRFNIESIEAVSTRSIDSLLLSNVDFIKVDLQGAEQLVLSGGRETLKGCLGLEVEVEFVELYERQPLFGDVSEFLRRQGFLFHDFTNLCRWNRKSLTGDGHCVFGDALFIKDIDKSDVLESLSDERFAALLVVLLVYRRFDLFEMLAEADRFATTLGRLNLDTDIVRSRGKKLLRSHRQVLRLNRYLSDLLGYMGPGYYNHFMY